MIFLVYASSACGLHTMLDAISGDLDARGITAFAGHVCAHDGSAAAARVSKAYDIKFVSTRLAKHKFCTHVPFLPTYTGTLTLPKCRKPSTKKNNQYAVHS